MPFLSHMAGYLPPPHTHTQKEATHWNGWHWWNTQIGAFLSGQVSLGEEWVMSSGAGDVRGWGWLGVGLTGGVRGRAD